MLISISLKIEITLFSFKRYLTQVTILILVATSYERYLYIFAQFENKTKHNKFLKTFQYYLYITECDHKIKKLNYSLFLPTLRYTDPDLKGFPCIEYSLVVPSLLTKHQHWKTKQQNSD